MLEKEDEYLKNLAYVKCLTKNVLTISSEVRSVIRKELKNKAGGRWEIKKINRPISLRKERLFKKRSVGKLTSLLGAFQ